MNAIAEKTRSCALFELERLLQQHQAALLSRDLPKLEDCVQRLREAVRDAQAGFSRAIVTENAGVSHLELKLAALRIQEAARVQIALLRRQQQFGRFLARLAADPAEPYRPR